MTNFYVENRRFNELHPNTQNAILNRTGAVAEDSRVSVLRSPSGRFVAAAVANHKNGGSGRYLAVHIVGSNKFDHTLQLVSETSRALAPTKRRLEWI